MKRFGKPVAHTAQAGQQAYDSKRQNSRPRGKWNKELDTIVGEELELTWPSEQIANTVARGRLSFKTIYNWVYAGKLRGITVQSLRP